MATTDNSKQSCVPTSKTDLITQWRNLRDKVLRGDEQQETLGEILETGDLLVRALTADETADVRIESLIRALHAKQAKIDALMLEFCPGEMSAEQKAEWATHQAPGSPLEPEAECAHTLMMPESTLTVIDPFKAKCRVCYEFFDLPLDGPQSSEKASPADLVGALQDRVHKEIGITRPAHAVKASEHVHDWVYAGPNLESCYCSATRHVNGTPKL